MKKNYFIEEVKQNELTRKKHKKICRILNYAEHLVILASTVTGCVPISSFASLVGTPLQQYSFNSTAAIKIDAITAEIKKYKSIIKKKKKTHDEIVLLPKIKSITVEVLISRALIDSKISHDEFVSVNKRI